MNRIESLLRHTIGLDVASVGASAIDRTLRLRMKALGFEEVAAYLSHVSATPAEWEELLEAVVVAETWFFRDASPFKAFVQLAQQELQLERAQPLRVLSVPCSTGEEPYSLAMALRDAGVARDRYRIEAVDISARALERAQRGQYGKNSFRGKTLEFRDRYFTAHADGFLLRQELRQDVDFSRGNLLEENFFANREPYDFVFCRNLLIYFDRATQRRALQRLNRLLTPSGVLFVGPAELPLVTDNGFTPIGLPMSFGCRKSTSRLKTGGERKTPRPVGLQSRRPVAPASAPAAPQPAAPSSASSPARQFSASLLQARSLADAGELENAAALCNAHVTAEGPSAEAYYLLGLVSDAAGDAAAMDYYRKALYLEPNHYETLLQVALLLERNGDRSGAQTFKRRAQRLRLSSE